MLSEYVYQIYTTVIASLAGFIAWLVRRVLTNQEEIKLLQQEIKTRDTRRDEDRQIILRLQDTLEKKFNDLQSQIVDLYKQK